MSLTLIKKFASNGLSPARKSLDFDHSIERDQVSFLKSLSKVINERKQELLNAQIERDMKYFSQPMAKKQEEIKTVQTLNTKFGGRIP